VRARTLQSQQIRGMAEPTAEGQPLFLSVGWDGDRGQLCVSLREPPCVVEVRVFFVTTRDPSTAVHSPWFGVVTNERAVVLSPAPLSPGWAMIGLNVRAALPTVCCGDSVGAVGRLDPAGCSSRKKTPPSVASVCGGDSLWAE